MRRAIGKRGRNIRARSSNYSAESAGVSYREWGGREKGLRVNQEDGAEAEEGAREEGHCLSCVV